MACRAARSVVRGRTGDDRSAPGGLAPFNTSDLFVMKADGTGETWLARGSSGTWSPDGRFVAYHASASGTGQPIKTDPGAAASDSDIFVVSADGQGDRRNRTNDPRAIDDDPD